MRSRWRRRAARAEGQERARRRVPARVGERARRLVRRHDSPIVGRDEELAAIDQALREVSETRAARMITIVGDAGIGKSRLAQEVIARAGAKARASSAGAASPYGDGITFWPLREMTGEAAEIRFDDKPEEGAREAARAGGRRRTSPTAWPPRRPEPRHLPAARDLLGGAQVPRVARRRRPAGRAASTTSTGPSRRSSTCSMHVLDTSESAPILLLCTSRHDLLEKRPTGASGASAHAAGAAPADRRGRGARWRSTCSAPPACRPTSSRASSRPPRATRCTSSRCCRCSSTAAPCARRRGDGCAPRATARSRSRPPSRR